MKKLTLKRIIITFFLISIISSIAYSATTNYKVNIHEDVWLSPENEDFKVSFSDTQTFDNITVTTDYIKIGGDYYDFADPIFGDGKAFDIDADNEVQVVLMNYTKNNYEDTNIKFNTTAISGTSSSFQINNLLSDKSYILREDGTVIDHLNSDGSGVLIFDYNSFSTHTLSIEDDEPPIIENESPADDSVKIRADQDLTLSADISNLEKQDVTVDFSYKGSVIDTKTISSEQEVSTVLGSSQLNEDENPAWSITATDSAGNSYSETYNFHTDAKPVIGSATPTNDEIERTYNPELKVNISDTDFQNTDDQVTVTWYVDGTSRHTETISSDQEVSYTTDNLNPGDHTWYITAEDSLGNTVQSSDYSFKIPGKLYIRDIKNPNKLINSTNYDLANKSIELFFYHNEETYVKETSSGVLDLTDLPAWDFVVNAQAEGWTNRRIYIEDIFDQNNIFLLNEANNTVVEPEFVKTDYTGNYPDESTLLLIEQGLTVNNETEWRTIEGDYFGAGGTYPSKLEKDNRYRLTMKNTDTGDTRVLGTYIPQVSRTVELEIGGIEVGVEKDEGYYWRLSRDDDAKTIGVTYNDQDNATTELQVLVYEHGNPSSILSNVTKEGPFGEYKLTESLTDAEMNQTWVAELTITRDGETFTETSTDSSPIDGINPFSEMGDTWTQVLVLGFLLMLAGLFSQVHSGIGAIILALVGTVFWWLGWLAVGIGIIVLVNAIAIINHLAGSKEGAY